MRAIPVKTPTCLANVLIVLTTFFYICTEVTSAQKRPVTTDYYNYFGVKVTSHLVHHLFNKNRNWLKKVCSMRFAVPMIWRDLTNHTDDCYSFMILPLKHDMSRKKKLTVEYADIPSSTSV